MEPTGSEKSVNNMTTAINLLIFMTAGLVLVQFCELLIYRSSSTMVKLADDDTDFFITFFILLLVFFYYFILFLKRKSFK